MLPVLTSFLPPTHTHLYLPALFKIWEAFNSSVIDDRLLEMCGELSEEHVSSTAGDAGQGGAPWKDVGIWTESQWATLVGKGLGSISKFFFFSFSPCIEFCLDVPVGAMEVIFPALFPQKSSLIFVFRDCRIPLPMQIGWIKVVKESRKPLAEYVCIHNLKLSRMELISAIF
jgi:hypothetical protein